MRKIDRQELIDMGLEDHILMEPDYLDEALIGISESGQGIYSYDALIDVITKNEHITPDEARDYIDVNILNVYVSDVQPIIMTTEFYNYK